MSENVNPLLFSAASSVFDNLSPSAVLLPPQNNSIGGGGGGNASHSSSVGPSSSPALIAASPTTVMNSQSQATAPTNNLPAQNSINNSFVSTNQSFSSVTLPNFALPESRNSNISSLEPSSQSSFTNRVSPAITPTVTPRITPCATPLPAPPTSSLTPPIPPSKVFTPPVSLGKTFTLPLNPPSNFTPLFPPTNFNPNIAPSTISFGPPVPPSTTSFVSSLPPSSIYPPPVPLQTTTFGPPVPPSTFSGPPMPLFLAGTTPTPPTNSNSFLPPFGGGEAPPPPSNSSTIAGGLQPFRVGLSTNTSQQFHPSSAGPAIDSQWAPPIYGAGPDQQESGAVVPPSFEKMAAGVAASMQHRYRPVIPHWFFLSSVKPALWKPFSFTDSINLEEVHRQGGCGLVSTDGGRYDVEVSSRVRRPVYWGGLPDQDAGDLVRRCSWFRKLAVDATAPQPYEEEVAQHLEEAYRECVESGAWHRQVEVEGDCPGLVMIVSPYSMHHYSTNLSGAFPTSVSISESQSPDLVKRGADDFAVSDGEADQVDHLLFLVHGIGPVCDLSFRSVEQCVDTFRDMGSELVSTHFQQSVESGAVGRVEVLPVSWHKALHSDTDGIDERLKPITLRSIPMLRGFTNDTILDVLLYTSPAYCQLIIDTVSSELNRQYRIFCHRHPNFKGGVSVAGHSLGAVILVDLLMHQKPVVPLPNEMQDKNPASAESDQSSSSNQTVNASSSGQQSEDLDTAGDSTVSDVVKNGDGDNAEVVGVENLQKRGVGSVLTASAMRARRSQADLQSSMTSSVNFEMGTAGTGQPSIAYPQLLFQPQAAFLLGSPVAMFLTVRGLTQLSAQYRLPTCRSVFNIFHPYDPVAYRLETLINPHLTELRPLLVPHHKGRKRMHLELKDTIERVGSDIKHKIVDSIQSTWNKLYYLYTGEDTEQQQEEMEQAVEQQLGHLTLDASSEGRGSIGSVADDGAAAVEVGQLNNGRRIDYVLQEKPYESLTEYIFALQAHLSYWKSEDTLLLMLKEIYGSMGIRSDAKVSHASSSIPSTPRKTSLTSGHMTDNMGDGGPTASSPMTHLPPPPAVIPMFTLPQAANNSNDSSSNATQAAPLLPPAPPSVGGSNAGPLKVLAGRPIIELSNLPRGMDPTADPQNPGSALPPPPTGTKINFSRKSALKR